MFLSLPQSIDTILFLTLISLTKLTKFDENHFIVLLLNLTTYMNLCTYITFLSIEDLPPQLLK